MDFQFPKFTKLDHSHKELLDRLFSFYQPYSDYNFTSLFAYDVFDQAEISILNDNIVLKFSDYVTGDQIVLFAGTTDLQSSLQTLYQYLEERCLKKKIMLVPEFVVEKLSEINHSFMINEDSDQHDYVLDVVEISQMIGKKYYDKRNLINRFRRYYPTHEVRLLDLQDPRVKEDVLKLTDLWKSQSKLKEKDYHIEYKAIKKLLMNIEHLNLFGLGVYVDGSLVGYSIFELLDQEFGMIHFEKGDIRFEGVYSVLVNETAKVFESKGIKYINYQQDLGLIGLRKAKQLWRPVNFLKKYTISYS